VRCGKFSVKSVGMWRVKELKGKGLSKVHLCVCVCDDHIWVLFTLDVLCSISHNLVLHSPGLVYHIDGKLSISC